MLCTWWGLGVVGWWAAPASGEDGQGQVGHCLPEASLLLSRARRCPQGGESPRVAVTLQQLPILETEDVQGGPQAGRVPRLHQLLHQLWAEFNVWLRLGWGAPRAGHGRTEQGVVWWTRDPASSHRRTLGRVQHCHVSAILSRTLVLGPGSTPLTKCQCSETTVVR